MRMSFAAVATTVFVIALGFVVVHSCTADNVDTSPAVAHLRGEPLHGAIFTTLEDGTRVNANIYEEKEDVYLDGGPGPNAPIGAAGLPEGDYYFQVTDPSGKKLLSEDHISCRRVHVSAEGVIDLVYPGTNYVREGRDWVGVPCQHLTGIDEDHNAVTVQLMPYENTPNRGGVYKAWMTRVEDYMGDPGYVPIKRRDSVNGESYEPGNYHGFAPSASKTDNYKVRRRRNEPEPMLLVLRKFHDANMNTTMDEGEEEVSGWSVGVADPIGTSNNYYTRAEVNVTEGTWLAVEEHRDGTFQTVAFLDGEQQSAYPQADPIVSVTFTGKSGETHEVLYGNCGSGAVSACKVYDRDGDGEVDEGEPGVPGWTMTLEGTDITGEPIEVMVQTTGEDGCAHFGPLPPGTYTVTEQAAAEPWRATSDATATVTVESTLDGSDIRGTVETVSFTNLCTGEAAFGTKGFWHNKNGLQVITNDDVAYVNGLAPYATPSSYFGDGDEPFDGHFTDGTDVEAQLGEAGEVVAPAGTPKAEISRFLVDSNANGDPREQLAQQLLAFIFNARHNLDDPSAAVEMPDGTFRSAQGLIDEAVQTWSEGTDAERNAMAALLDGFNNNQAVRYIRATPCDVPTP